MGAPIRRKTPEKKFGFGRVLSLFCSKISCFGERYRDSQ